MDLKELLAKLSEEEQGVVLKAIEDKEKLAKFTAKSEAESTLSGQIEDYKKALGVLGYEKGDASEFASSLAEKLKEQKQEGGENLAVEELKTQLQSLKDELKSKEETTRNLTISTKIDKALGKKFIGKQFIIDELIKSGQAVLDGDKVFYKTDAGVKSIEDAVKDLEKDNRFSELAVVEQKGGSGDTGGDTTPKELGVKLDGSVDDILGELNL